MLRFKIEKVFRVILRSLFQCFKTYFKNWVLEYVDEGSWALFFEMYIWELRITKVYVLHLKWKEIFISKRFLEEFLALSQSPHKRCGKRWKKLKTLINLVPLSILEYPWIEMRWVYFFSSRSRLCHVLDFPLHAPTLNVLMSFGLHHSWCKYKKSWSSTGPPLIHLRPRVVWWAFLLPEDFSLLILFHFLFGWSRVLSSQSLIALEGS